jgi:hypothetical protein
MLSEMQSGEGVAATGLYDPLPGNQRCFLTGSKRIWDISPTIRL